MNSRSPHILNTSANLLGICFFVFTTIHHQGNQRETLIDEFTVAAIFLFMSSCLISFFSMKTTSEARAKRFESRADLVFLLGLIILFLTTIMASLEMIR